MNGKKGKKLQRTGGNRKSTDAAVRFIDAFDIGRKKDWTENPIFSKSNLLRLEVPNGAVQKI